MAKRVVTMTAGLAPDANGGAADRRRPQIAIAVLVLHVLIGWLLLSGLSVEVTRRAEAALSVFEVREVPRPVEVAAPKPRAPRKSGASAPVNRTAKASPVVAPEPIVLPPIPPPSLAAVVAGFGADPDAGAAPIIGPGTGAGGEGKGKGSGDAGDGDGGGGGTPLRLLSGRIGNRDYPRAALQAGASGTVHLRFVVDVDGRAHDCEVTRSSGNADLDATTCKLIEKRLRYRPETDAAGRPYAVVVTGRQVWELAPRPPVDPVLVDHGWAPPPPR
ncbi:energy transducer TonB [Sandarakinorhabdus sp. DWP1-3-1]|uniref:energy transducer TonB n=1 Tax=Sandarakinorhabdus sp. DWP1-3-1 TaxID=2804627 RepID=UPI003CF2B0D3